MKMKGSLSVHQVGAFILQLPAGQLRASAGARQSAISRKTHFRVDGARARCTLRGMDHADQHDLAHAWCWAVQSWLRCQGLMAVSINQQPVIPFSPKMAS